MSYWWHVERHVGVQLLRSVVGVAELIAPIEAARSPADNADDFLIRLPVRCTLRPEENRIITPKNLGFLRIASFSRKVHAIVVLDADNVAINRRPCLYADVHKGSMTIDCLKLSISRTLMASMRPTKLPNVSLRNVKSRCSGAYRGYVHDQTTHLCG